MKKDFGAVSPELQSKLQKADPEIQQFVINLLSEIRSLQKRLVSLETKNVVLNERVKALETLIKKIPTPVKDREAQLEELREFLAKHKPVDAVKH